MRRTVKSILALLLAAALLGTLTGCGAPSQEEEPEVPGSLYCSKTVYPFPTDTEIEAVVRSGAHLFLTGKQGEQHLFGRSSYVLSANGEGSVAKAELLTPETEGFETEPIWYGLCADEKENVWLLLGDRDGEGASSRLVLQKYLTSGRYHSSIELRGWSHQTVDSFSVGPEGEFVLLADDTVTVFSPGGQLLSETEKQGWTLESLFWTEAGVVLSSSRRSRENGSIEAAYERIDSVSGQLTPWDHPAPETMDTSLQEVRSRGGRLSPCQGLEGELLFNDGYAIYAIRLEEEGLEKLVVWNREQNLNRSSESACRLGSDSFAAVLNGELVLSWSEPDLRAHAETVRVAVFGAGYELLVQEANNNSSSYRYEAQVFSATDKDRLAAEIAQGTFDLLLLDSGINTSSSLFLDLYPLLDADPDLSREDFLPHLLESSELHGELHQLWNSVDIFTMAAPEALVPDAHGLTLADCERIVGESEEFFSVWYSMDREMIAREYPVLIANYSLAVFVDKEAGTCRFDSEAFRELLSWCGRTEPSAEPETPPLLSTIIVSGARQLDTMAETRFPFTITGIPNGEDGLSFYALSTARGQGCAMAIPANSRNREGAWAFIKDLLSEGKQFAVSKSGGMPVLLDVLRDANENASPHAQEQLMALLECTRWSQLFFDDDLIELIVADCQPFMNGEKSLDETVALIQKRANIYVSERYS